MRQTFAQLMKLTKNSGQATVEYILLIVIVLALILGPLKQFSQFFNAYIDALFGSGQYFACLLETGELGGQSSDANSSCGAAFSASIQTAIAKSNAGSSTGSGSGTTNNSDPNAGSQANSQAAKAKAAAPQVANSGSGSSDSGGGGAEAPAGGGAGGGGSRPPARQVLKANAPAGGKDPGGESFVKMEGEQFDYKNLKPKNGFEVKIDRLDRRFSSEDDEEKRAEKSAPKTLVNAASKDLRAKEVSLDPPRAPAAKDADVSGDGFGFSMLLKWFLIACILIAIVIFVGGQAMQISKGGDN